MFFADIFFKKYHFNRVKIITMIPYKDEKIKSAVAFFAKHHHKKTKRLLYQTYLYKYLAFLDFWSLRETGRPVLELKYSAMKRGPVPIEIYSKKQDTEKYKFKKSESGEYIAALQDPDLDYFSQYEIELMDRLIEIFAQKWANTNTFSDASHEDIRAWKRTYYGIKKNGIIDYALEFDGDLFSKDESELTYPEEVYLTFKAVAPLTKTKGNPKWIPLQIMSHSGGVS